jgi:hypothetical protein
VGIAPNKRQLQQVKQNGGFEIVVRHLHNNNNNNANVLSGRKGF